MVYAACYAPPEGATSLSEYLDIHGEDLRAAYIAFIHDLGQQQVSGEPLVSALADKEGFSYWWMTHLAEKSPFKSPRIHDCLRLMALEDWMRTSLTPVQRLVLCGADEVVAKTLAIFCARRGISFRYQLDISTGSQGLLTRIHRRLPWSIKGLLSLRHWGRRWAARRLAAPAWSGPPTGLFMCSYFFNLNDQMAEEGHFYTRQWEDLPGQLLRDGWRLNWLHHLLLLPGINNVRDALGKAIRFNEGGPNQGCHSFVESKLGLGLIAGAMKEWILLGHKATRARKQLSFVPRGSQLDLWYLLEADWNTSLLGAIGLGNCIWRRLFDRALACMPRQAGGYYLWENQGWESAFLHAWKRHQPAPVIGFPHATTAFWHLNNFDDPRIFEGENVAASKPLPDQLAVSGPMAWRMFQASGYPVDRMVEVEAIRFQHLLQCPPRQQIHHPENRLRVLLLGDFSRQQSRAMGACLAQAAALWGGPLELTVKPHPITPLDGEDLPSLSFTLSEQPLGEILQGFDLAFASNSSSAALDAWLHGLPVAVFLDDSSLNHSPMRAAPGACFVSNGVQLARILAEGTGHPPMPANEFFWLDADLHRWRELVRQTAGKVPTHELNS